MTAGEAKRARREAGFTQQQAAERLDLTQAYLSMLERGKRRMRPSLSRRMADLYGVALVPTEARRIRWSMDEAAHQLGKLGYPGFAYLRSGRKKNPTGLLSWALAQPVLDARVAEALPWVVLHFEHSLDWDWLAGRVRLNDRQNRLGFLVSVARQIAERGGNEDLAARLRQREAELERCRLVAEDTYFEEVRSEGMREWLRHNRPPEAQRWGVLTDFGPQQVRYAH